MQPDACQQRQKVRNDVSLHRLCRYGGQNEEQTERRVGWGGDRTRNRHGDRQLQAEREDGDGSNRKKNEQVEA